MYGCTSRPGRRRPRQRGPPRGDSKARVGGQTILSKHHLLVSAALGVGIALAVTPPVSPLVVVGYAAVLGVGIDLDHFVVARLNTGNWRAARNAIRNPHIIVFEQSAVFEDGEVGAVQRLVSHVLITAVLVAALVPFSPYGAGVSAVVLVGHVLSDVVWDFTPLLGPPQARVRGE